MSLRKNRHLASCSTPDENKLKRRETRKSLFPCHSETSPVLQLTDDLQTLSTGINKLPCLHLCEAVGKSGQGGDHKKLSMDDGCCLESPAVSINSSPSYLFNKSKKAKSNTRFNLMKRFDSDPTNSKSSIDVGWHRLEDKENVACALRTIGEGDISPFKSPFSVARCKRVAFTNETNTLGGSRDPQDRKPRRSMSIPHGDMMDRQESMDDGFFDQVFNSSNSNVKNSNNSTSTSSSNNNNKSNSGSNSCESATSKVDLPKNFDNLLFFPVIDNSDSALNVATTAASVGTSSASLKPCASNFTSLKSSCVIEDSGPVMFQSPVSANQAVFKRPNHLHKPSVLGIHNSNSSNIVNNNTNNNSGSTKSSNNFNNNVVKFSNTRVLLRSESMNNEHNISSSSSSSSSSSDDGLCHQPVGAKRRKSNQGGVLEKKQLKKCQSLATLWIKSALKRDERFPDLIGDFTREYILPLVSGRHQDLKCISIQTMADLLCESYKSQILDFVIVDCRYPYEFEGGHIKNAINVHTSGDLLDRFFNIRDDSRPPCHNHSSPILTRSTGCQNHSSPIQNHSSPCSGHALQNDTDPPPANTDSPSTSVFSSTSFNSDTIIDVSTSDDDKENSFNERSSPQTTEASKQEKRSIIIFHCEFSSERGPHMCRYLRTMDRQQSSYPTLKYPELYLLEGGYKAFYERHPDLCEPRGYVQMHNPHYHEQLRLFKCRSSSTLSTKSASKSLWN